MLQAGVSDQEEYQISVFSALVNAEALRMGAPALWTNHFGFGTVLPLGHSFNHHPVFLLWPNAGLPTILALFWLGIVVGSACLAFWLRHLGVSRPITVIAILAYSLSTPLLTYMVVNDWPSAYLGWLMLPVLFYLVALLADRPVWRWVLAVWLGTAGGFTVINGHPGHVVILFVPLALYAFTLTIARPSMLLPGLLAGTIAVVINLENIVFLAEEVARFPADLPRESQAPYAPLDYLVSLARPFVAVSPTEENAWGLTWLFQANLNVRLPFLGVGFAVGLLLLATAVLLRRAPFEPHRIGLLLGLAASFVLSLLDPQTLGRLPSGAWLFRDGVALTGIAAGALGLEWLRSRHGATKLIAFLLSVQMAQTIAVAIPPLRAVQIDSVEDVFSKTGQTSPFLEWLTAEANVHGKRLYLSPRLSRDIRMGLTDRGLYSASDLVIAGLQPVNGWFKGTSQDVIRRSPVLMHGLIGTNHAQFGNARMLEVVGIDLLLAYESEAAAGMVPINYKEIGEEPGERTDPILLFANPQAWPRVSLLPGNAREIDLSIVADDACRDRGLLCLNFGPFPDRLKPDPLKIEIDRQRIAATLPSGRTNRIAFVSQLYRPAWRATIDDNPAEVSPIAGGALIGVEVPATGGRLELIYDTQLRQALWWLAALVLYGSFFTALVWTLLRLNRNQRQSS